jgi:YD repeat-containing protein
VHTARMSLTTAVSGTSTCADPGNPGTAAVATTGYVYDSGDRLVSDTATGAGAWVYDSLGRITTAPVRGSPGAVVRMRSMSRT